MNVKVTVTIKSDSCLICGKRNKGLHFNVASCRACAAFFRRSIRSKKAYKCQRGTGSCNLKIKVKGTPLCRYCRLQKCRQLGMDIDKEGSLTPSSSTSTMPIEHNAIELPKFSISNSSMSDIASTIPSEAIKKTTPNLEAYLENRPFEEKIKEILSSPYPISITLGIRLTFMQQLEYGFNQFYEAIKPTGEEFTRLDEIDDELYKHFQAKYMIGLAKMLMHCKQFAELDFEDKILLYKHLKPIFNQIERLYSSIQYKTENIHIPMLIYDNSAVDLEGNEIVHFKNRDKESFAKTRPLWLPFRDKLVNHLYVPMNEIKLTLHELIYLCGQILWSTQEINGISSNAHQIAEEITDQISSELHNYYMYEMRLVNYAPRLVKMIKLIDGSKTVVKSLKDITIVSQVYNIFDFKADLSELVS